MSDTIHSPSPLATKHFTSPDTAVDYLIEIYDRNTAYLQNAFKQYIDNSASPGRYRVCYPEIRFSNDTYARVDSRWSYGHVDEPGEYSTTITQPRLFKGYLRHQLEILINNHGGGVDVGESNIAIPLHFALGGGEVTAPATSSAQMGSQLRDSFDVPDIAHVNDYIVNGTYEPTGGMAIPLAPFPAQRIDYSLHRLKLSILY